MGKLLIIFGIILLIVGLVIHFNLKISWLGKLPGDFTIKRDGFTLFIPLATSLIISALLSMVLFIITRLK